MDTVFFTPDSVSAALRRLSEEGVKIRQICIEISDGDTKYHTLLYSRSRGKKSVPLSILSPLIERVPQFGEYLRANPPTSEPLPPIEDDPDFQKLVAIEAELRRQIEFLQSQLERKDEQLSKLIDNVINRQ